jgi:DNA repair exonuclease SbcCD ATPase subunit
MKIISVTLNNYGPYEGQHTFYLDDRGLLLVLGDNQDEPRMNSNGSGKSGVFDAMDWCLFGKVPRGDHADSVINERVRKDCWVVTRMNDNGVNAAVRRARAPKGLSFAIDGEPETALDDAETQRRIERWLGLDRDVFHAAVLYGQLDLTRFADKRDSDRIAILTKVLQLEEIDQYLENAKTIRAEKAVEYEEKMSSLQRLEGQLTAYRSQDYAREAADWSDMRAERLRVATQVLNDKLAEIEKWKAVAAQEHTVAARERQVLLSRVTLDLSSYDTQLSTLGADRDRQRLAQGRAKAEGDRLNQRRDKVLKMEGDCNECGQPITREHLNSELFKIDSAVSAQREFWTEASQQLGTIEASIQSVVAAKEQQRQAHYEADKQANLAWAEVQQFKKHVADAKAFVAQATEYVAATLRPQMEKTRTGDNPFHAKQAEVDQAIVRLELEKKGIQQEASVIESNLALYDFWVQGFGSKGLKSYILDTKLTELTTAANKWVHLLTGGTIWVRFETQTMGRSTKKLANKLNIRVFRYNRNGSISERNYRSWSGGEKQRISLGIDFGLSRLVARRASKTYDLLILDELFKHLDQAGREAVMEMLQVFRQEKSSVIVVDHDETFQEAFENRVVIRKQNGCSRIEEVQNETQSA